MAASLLTLLDDLASLFDDVATMTKVATQKTAGVIGDDLALNADQVTGMTADRELPVIWAVAKGALVNKVILVPVALLISAFVPKAIVPLLMVGGLFLCYEGFHKIWHKLTAPSAADSAERAARVQAVADTSVDMQAFERERIKGAIRTDFILSSEVIVIALGTMASQPVPQQLVALSIVGVGMVVLVYGLVAGLVKIDDLGLRLHRVQGDDRSAASQRQLGATLLRTAPLLMKALSILGTAAMFMVGGSILAHGIPVVEHAIAAISDSLSGFAATAVKTLLEAVFGIVAGGVVVAALSVVTRFSPTRATPPVKH